MSRRRWIGALVLVTTSTVVAAQAAPGPAGPADSTLSGTAVLSPRRVPAWVESQVAAQRLAATANSRVAVVAPALTDANPPGCVVAKQGARVLYSLAGSQAFLPASNMKILTALGVVEQLGPNYRLTTRVAAGQAAQNGVVYGNLYLVGGGDPLLRTASFVAGLNPPQPVYTSLDQLAAQVRAAGVRVVTGDVVGDDSRYDSQRTVPTWKPIYLTEGDVAPLSALEVDDDAAPAPPRNPVSTTTTTAKPGTPPAPTTTTTVPPPPPRPDPALQAASDFRKVLAKAGVEVYGGAATGSTPAGAPQLTAVQSPPLWQEIDAMLEVSDDTAAELLTKELGYAKQKVGSTAAGTALIRSDLAADGLDISGLVNLDGSGLDRGDRVSCNLLVGALQRAGSSGFVARGLPVAGKSGTLSTRFVGTPAAGRLRAKTGTLQDVASLSGFIDPDPRLKKVPQFATPVAFSIIINGVRFDQAQAIADQVALALTTFPSVPPIATVGPARSASRAAT